MSYLSHVIPLTWVSPFYLMPIACLCLSPVYIDHISPGISRPHLARVESTPDRVYQALAPRRSVAYWKRSRRTARRPSCQAKARRARGCTYPSRRHRTGSASAAYVRSGRDAGERRGRHFLDQLAALGASEIRRVADDMRTGCGWGVDGLRTGCGRRV